MSWQFAINGQTKVVFKTETLNHVDEQWMMSDVSGMYVLMFCWMYEIHEHDNNYIFFSCRDLSIEIIFEG